MDKYNVTNFDGIFAVVEAESNEIVCLMNPSDCHITEEQAEENAEIIAGRLNAFEDVLKAIKNRDDKIATELWPMMTDDEDKEILESIDDEFYKELFHCKKKARLI